MKQSVQIRVDTRKKEGPLDHLWRYIGYDECNYTYIPEGKELLRKFAALPDAPYYFRTHFMFCTGNCHGTYKFGSTNLYTEDAEGNPVYDFEVYDRIIDAYLECGAKPFLELGFMPMDLVDHAYLTEAAGDWNHYNQYKDIGWTCPPKDYDKWHGLIEALARHLLEKYGADEVKSWYFELWNEPDIFYWSGSTAEYCRLYDYTEHALHAVLPDARLSGPAVTGIFEGNHAQEFFDFFLAHCRDGANFCTGAKGTRLDFITFHVKGGGFPFRVNAPKAVPSVYRLVHQVKLGLDSIVKYGYQDREVVLSEADPDGWAAGGVYDNQNMIFRNTEYYATYVASTYEKIEKLSAQYGIAVHPLAWAFLFPGERCFEGTRTFSTQGIDKAVFNLFKIYGQLGGEKLFFESDGAHPIDFSRPAPQTGDPAGYEFDGPGDAPDVTGFAAQGKNGECQIVIVSHHDDRDFEAESDVTVTVHGFGDDKNLRVRHYRIDREHSDAYAEWLRQGSPIYPTPEQYAAIKSRDSLEEYVPETRADSTGDALTLTFPLPAHGVSYLVIERTVSE